MQNSFKQKKKGIIDNSYVECVHGERTNIIKLGTKSFIMKIFK